MADQLAQDRNMVPDSRAEFEALENAQEAMKQAHQHLLFADACGGVTVFDSHAIQETCEALHDAIEGLKPIQVATQRQQERIAYVEKIADDAIELGNQQAIRIAELEAQVQALSLDAGRYRYLRSHCLCAGHGSITVFLDDRYGTGNRAKPLHLEEINAAIDAAIAAGKGEA